MDADQENTEKKGYKAKDKAGAAGEGPGQGTGTDIKTGENACGGSGQRPGPCPQGYVVPPLDFFDAYPETVDTDQATAEKDKERIVRVFDFCDISVTVVRVTVGPSVTRYEIAVPDGVTVQTAEKYKDIFSEALQVWSVCICPGSAQGTIAIEVPNRKRAVVGMRNMLESPGYVNADPDSLTFCIGRDTEGKKVFGDLAKAGHLLVAGASGSGRDTFLNAMIISMIMKHSPGELRLILIDLKVVEFLVYDRLPHLLTGGIISDPLRAVAALDWVTRETERRHALFAKREAEGRAVREIGGYNASVTDRAERLPSIVLIVNDLSLLMMSDEGKEAEDRIVRIAARARAAGIHLVLATGWPSADVLTDALQSAFPSRVALTVRTEEDSRRILGEKGAETLCGNGDMLYRFPGMDAPARVQGAWISGAEISRVCGFIRENNEACFDRAASDFIESARKSGAGGGAGKDGLKEAEPVYIDALRFVVQSGSASISMISRKFHVGYNKAGKIIEWMEQSGYISPFDGAKPRKVLLSEDEFRKKYGGCVIRFL